MTGRTVTLLTNFVPPYLVSLLDALGKRVGRLRILVSTEMEGNRPWSFQGAGLPVEVQRTWTLRRRWRHPQGFSERMYLHLPVDTLWRLWRSRPQVIVTTEFGLRTLQALFYGALRPEVRVVVWALVSETTERGRGRLRSALRRWMLRGADAVVVSGESGARYVAGLGFPDAAIFRVPPYAEPAQPPAAACSEELRVDHRLLYVGQLVERKGVAEFLTALADWAEAHLERSAEVWIVGDGPARERLAARPLPPNVSIRFWKNIAYEELPACYAQAGILVFPTLADEWGVVVNEALAAGLPVLGSVHSQAVEELVHEGETGWRFRSDRRAEFAAALERALATPAAELERMRARCRERASGFAPEAVAARLHAAIEFAATNLPDVSVCPACRGGALVWRRLPHTTAWECTSPRCGLRFAAPQPDEAALRDAYRRLYYPDDAGSAPGACDDTPPEIAAALAELIVERIGGGSAPRAPGDGRADLRLLDYGCGRGALAQEAAARGLHATGVEPDPAARAAAGATGLPVFESLDALAAAEPDARFDVALLWQVIEHLREPWRELAALRERLAPGGLAVVATPNSAGLRARLAGAAWENVRNPTHLHYFTARSLRRVLESAGFVLEARVSLRAAYPHHGAARRVLQRGLRALGLDGDLLVVARAPGPDVPGAARGDAA